MTDDPIALLERELVAAAHRRLAPPGDLDSAPRRARGRTSRRLPVQVRAPALIALVLVPVAAVASALIRTGAPRRAAPLAGRTAVTASTLSTGRLTWYRADGTVIPRIRPPQPKPGAASGPPARLVPLMAALGVLRRPQTAADLTLPQLHRPSFTTLAAEAAVGIPERSELRMATVSAWGARVYLLPFRPPTQSVIDALPARARASVRRQAPRRETLWAFTGANQGAELGSAPQIAAGNGLLEYGGGVQASRRLPLQLILVVPDGVHSVAFTISQPGGTSVHRVPVRSNVATLQVGAAPPTNPRQIVWYGAHGTILRRYSPRAGTG